jgi:hypothetical protein
MTSPIDERRLVVIARAASDLRAASLVGQNSPYLELQIGDSATMVTKVAEKSPENPIFDEKFEITLPGAVPGEAPPKLRIVAKNKTMAPLVPDTVIGRGSVDLTRVFGAGKEDVKVLLHDNEGNDAGAVFVAVEVPPAAGEEAVPSAAGTVLGEVARTGPKPGTMAAAGGEPLLSGAAAEVSPDTPLVGAVAPGGVEDPSNPAYGILKD